MLYTHVLSSSNLKKKRIPKINEKIRTSFLFRTYNLYINIKKNNNNSIIIYNIQYSISCRNTVILAEGLNYDDAHKKTNIYLASVKNCCENNILQLNFIKSKYIVFNITS